MAAWMLAAKRHGGEGWRVDGEEGCGEGTPAANRLGDHRSPFRGGYRASSSRDLHEAGRSRGGGVTDPHRLRGDGAWERISFLE